MALSTRKIDVTAVEGLAPGRSRRLAIRIAFYGTAALAALLSGCAVVSIVSTAATVTAGVVSTAVDLGVGAVKVTGKLIGKGVDAVTSSGPSPPSTAPSLPKPASN